MKYITVVIGYEDDICYPLFKEGLPVLGGIVDRCEDYNAIKRIVNLESKLHDSYQKIKWLESELFFRPTEL